MKRFTSKSIEDAIKTFKAGVTDKEQGWLFENCFPNTLDTTVFHSTIPLFMKTISWPH